MSNKTMSLMPFKKRVSIMKTHIIELPSQYGTFLGAAEKTLKDAGALSNRILTLEKGTDIRIEGFKAFALSKEWALTKITVFHTNYKACQLYVNLDKLEGLEWTDEIMNDAQKKLAEKRIVVRLDEYFVKALKTQYFMHKSFSKYSARLTSPDLSELILLNVSVLTPEEIKSQKLAVSNSYGLGECVFKSADESRNYRIWAIVTLNYRIIVSPGMMHALISDIQFVMYGQERRNETRHEIAKFDMSILDVSRLMLEKPILKKWVSEFYKKLHNIQKTTK